MDLVKHYVGERDLTQYETSRIQRFLANFALWKPKLPAVRCGSSKPIERGYGNLTLWEDKEETRWVAEIEFFVMVGLNSREIEVSFRSKKESSFRVDDEKARWLYDFVRWFNRPQCNNFDLKEDNFELRHRRGEY